MVKKRRTAYRHRVRRHVKPRPRKVKPVRTHLRGKGAPRNRRKYVRVDGYVRKKKRGPLWLGPLLTKKDKGVFKLGRAWGKRRKK